MLNSFTSVLTHEDRGRSYLVEELLEEDKMNVTDMNNLIYAAATIMTQTLNEPSKRSKNRRDVKFWKIQMQKQISSWRKVINNS